MLFFAAIVDFFPSRSDATRARESIGSSLAGPSTVRKDDVVVHYTDDPGTPKRQKVEAVVKRLPAALIRERPVRRLSTMSEPRRFYIRTFGCQMNEHDSERIAGLLAADGMEHTDDVDEADVVVFNTCCVRENADNKLYGQLGRLKGLKERRPDLQIAVGGCLAQKDRDLIVERAAHVDVVFGTHNLAHAPALLERARLEGPIVEILEEHEAYPSALPARRDVGHSAWVTIQIGCDNSCTFCIVPIVRVARSAGGWATSCARSRSSPPTASPRSHCSDRT